MWFLLLSCIGDRIPGIRGVKVKPVFNILPDVLILWKNVLPLMFLGLFLGNLLLNTSLMRHLGMGMRPLARLGNLPAGCDTPLTLCLINRVAAYSMLAELKNNGTVGGCSVFSGFRNPQRSLLHDFFLCSGGSRFSGVAPGYNLSWDLLQYLLDGGCCGFITGQTVFAATGWGF